MRWKLYSQEEWESVSVSFTGKKITLRLHYYIIRRLLQKVSRSSASADAAAAVAVADSVADCVLCCAACAGEN